MRFMMVDPRSTWTSAGQSFACYSAVLDCPPTRGREETNVLGDFFRRHFSRCRVIILRTFRVYKPRQRQRERDGVDDVLAIFTSRR